jgi:competence protein ComEC
LTLVYLAAAWLLGIVAAALWDAPVAAAAVIAAVGLALALAKRRPQPLALGLLAAALFAGAVWRYEESRPPSEPSGLAVYNDADAVRIRALVVEEPEVRGRVQRMRLEARELWQEDAWQPVDGGVLLRRGAVPRYRYGDLLEIEGKLNTPPELPDFNYREYLARQGVQSTIDYPRTERLESGQGNPAMELVHATRQRLSSALGRALPEPQASLAQGILLGQRSALPRDLADDLNATNTSHIVAISGYNVTLVAGLIVGTLAWFTGRRQAALLALAAIAFYTVLTGASPSIVRAAIMGGLFLTATLVGRPGSALASIVTAAALMTAWHPLAIHDVSFQLSFAAVVGLAYLAPELEARAAGLLGPRIGGEEVLRRGWPNLMLDVSTVTTAAVLATLPIIALNFERISLVGLPANLLVVPAFPLIFTLSAAAAVVGAVAGGAGQYVAWAAWLPLTYMIETARTLADLPFASVSVRGFGMGHAAAFYAALGAFTWWVGRQRPGQALLSHLWALLSNPLRWLGRPVRAVPTAWLAGGLAFAAVLVWWAVLSAPGDRLTVTVMDVGQGDAILIRGPEGHKVLVDGGPSGDAVAEALGRELPFWDRKLHMVILTHPQEDHLVGLLTVLERYEVEQVVAGVAASESAAFTEWRKIIERKKIPYHEAVPGEWIDLGRGASLEVLAPPADPSEGTGADLNNNSVVLRLAWDAVSFLLPGDLEAEGEAALLDAGGDLRATVLKVAHHGSAASSSDAFLAAVRPLVSVISVGEDNSFNHPSPSTLDKLAGTVLYRSDENGRLRLSSDGRSLRIEVDRGEPALPSASQVP